MRFGRIVAALGRHRLLLALVVVDVATKLAAFHFLPHGQAVTVVPGLRLYLALNEWGVMGGAEGIDAVTANPAYTILLAAGLVLFAAVILRLSASSIAFGWQVFAGLLIFLAIAFLTETLAASVSHVALPAGVIVGTIRLAVLTVSLAFYFASSSPSARAPFTLLAAGALANAASYVYPPYTVVDFLMIPLEAFSAAADSTSVGVINLADVYLFLFPLLLLAWPATALVRRTRAALG